MGLPRFVVLKSTLSGKYLSYIRDDLKTPRFIQSSGDEVASPFAKFELEPAKTGNDDGSKNVHIKCCYNNKYWCVLSEGLFWVVAGSDKKVEDKTKWSCTLFEPVVINGNDKDEKVIHLRHVHLGFYLSLDSFDKSHDSMLFAGGSMINDSDSSSKKFKIIDSDSLVVLPKHVAFKGDNGKYLGGCTHRDIYHFLEFAFTDKGKRAVGNEVCVVGDDCIRVKSNFNGRYWCAAPNWVRAESDESTADEDSYRNLFKPFKVANKENTIALLHIGSKRFCKRLTDYWVDSLCADVETMTNETYLVVEELIVSRKISNIDYHITDATIYSGDDGDEEIIGLSTQTATNLSDQTDTVVLNFEYEDMSSSTWTSHYSFTFGVRVEFEAGIPLIGKSKVEISASVTGGHQWGKTEQSVKKNRADYSAVVPPKSITTVTMKAIKASCHIPFSYTQRDILPNSQEVIYDKHDGIYTGSNYFKFDFVKETKPI